MLKTTHDPVKITEVTEMFIGSNGDFRFGTKDKQFVTVEPKAFTPLIRGLNAAINLKNVNDDLREDREKEKQS